jgi:hypothetical protein
LNFRENEDGIDESTVIFFNIIHKFIDDLRNGHPKAELIS